MRNRPDNKSLTMTPDGSLNHLEVECSLLSQQDPLMGADNLTGAQLASSLALQQLITHFIVDHSMNIRRFLDEFSDKNAQHNNILDCYSRRLASVINTAKAGQRWPSKANTDLTALMHYWQNTDTIVISGGLTTGSFGQFLASRIETLLPEITVLSSPWAGQTALIGLAQTVKSASDLLVIDFGATGIKRAVASNYGNRLKELTEFSTVSFTDAHGHIGKQGVLEVLRQTRRELSSPLPVAISLACYLNQGHPFQYKSGIYYPLEADCDNLTKALNDEWLPSCGLGSLALLEHDSSAAGLAFRFSQPAMMITLGTGLGSGPCPLA
ncbi:hypothetical protein KO489_10085 [Reinekea forsetii]|nr:hypothetical protein [Reinekea forsetii]